MPRFNPAPGWPQAPEGWLPGPGWTPDPSWPKAPEGWQIIIDDEPQQGDALARVNDIAASLRERHAVRSVERAEAAKAKEAELKADGRLFDFESHIEGKNARVRLYPDRLEWERQDKMTTGAKAATAVMTMGLSYAATGFKQNRDTETIYVRQITSVKTKRHIVNTSLIVIAAGNTIDMKISHDEADRVKRELNMLMAGTHPSQQAVAEPTPATPQAAQPAGGPSLMELAAMHQQGILTDEEFAAAKRKALGL